MIRQSALVVVVVVAVVVSRRYCNCFGNRCRRANGNYDHYKEKLQLDWEVAIAIAGPVFDGAGFDCRRRHHRYW